MGKRQCQIEDASIGEAEALQMVDHIVACELRASLDSFRGRTGDNSKVEVACRARTTVRNCCRESAKFVSIVNVAASTRRLTLGPAGPSRTPQIAEK